VDPVFDRASATSAVHWFLENKSSHHNEDIAEVLNDFLEYEDLGLLCYGETKPPVAAASSSAAALDRNRVELFNLKAFLSVVARITICCMWFGRGGVSSFPAWKVVAVVGGRWTHQILFITNNCLIKYLIIYRRCHHRLFN
jgi:hypothetical protein